MRIVFDARPLRSDVAHRGVGAVPLQIIKALPEIDFTGLAPAGDYLESTSAYVLRTWPQIPKLSSLFFDFSPMLAHQFDLYWGTNHLLPLVQPKPSVITVHDMLYWKHRQYPDGNSFPRYRAARFAASLRRAKYIVASSQATADDLSADFPELVPRLEIARLGPGIMTGNAVREAITGPASDALPKNPYCLLLGATSPRKNLALIRKIWNLEDFAGDIHLWYTGTSTCADSKENRPELSKIHNAGVLTPSLRNAFLKHAVALLQPSLYEGFGFPALEAMALGCPVLALDTPIHREICGEAALFLPNEPVAWRSAISGMVCNPSLRSELRDKGFYNVKRFDWGQTVSTYRDVFLQAVR